MLKITKIKVLITVTILGASLIFFLPPIPQDPAYHLFADQRQMFALSNFLNVSSNILFILFGAAGIYFLACNRLQGGLEEIKIIYRLFFIGMCLAGVGSAYYHLQPDNYSLMWDRLPMTLVFSSLFCLVVGEHISPVLARRLLAPLVLFGLLSVLYWQWGEIHGRGDLRLYALMQFFLSFLIVLILLLFRSRLVPGIYIVAMLVCYVLAKISEYYDVAIYGFFNQQFSGHSLKHLLASLVALVLLVGLHKRRLRVD